MTAIFGKWHMYDPITGIFTGMGFNGSEELLTLNTPTGYLAYKQKGIVDTLCHKVNIETGELESYQPPAPTNTEIHEHSWNEEIKRWEAKPTLLVLKTIKLQELKAAGEIVNYSNIVIQGNEIVADKETQEQLMHEAFIAQLAVVDGLNYSLAWERADGTPVTLTVIQLKTLIRTLRSRHNSLLSYYRTLKTQVVAATTKNQLDSIIWEYNG